MLIYDEDGGHAAVSLGVALKSGSPQPWLAPDHGMAGDGFLLFRVGDAVASRDVHAAILDSLRLMKDV